MAEVAWLTRIHEGRPLHRASGPAEDEEQERALRVLDRAHRAGAIAPHTECWWLEPIERARMQRHLLSLSEWHPEPETAVAARATWRIGVQGPGSVADATTQVLATSGLKSVPASEADLVVLVGAHGIDAPEALLPATAARVGEVPHLPVSAYRAHASIGPLVVPGRTPCLNCGYLRRCDTDPSWPRHVQQWRAAEKVVNTEADPLLAWHAAVTAVAMIRHWVDAAQTPSAHRITWRFPDPMPSHHVVVPHPACGCMWATQ